MPQRKCLTKFNSEQRGTLQQGIGPLCSHTFHGSLLPPGKNPTTQFGIQGLYGVWPQLLASEINPSPNSAFLYRFNSYVCISCIYIVSNVGFGTYKNEIVLRVHFYYHLLFFVQYYFSSYSS